MNDADDPIPIGMISIRDARDTVCRTITPDWQILEDRLNPASPSHGALQKQDAKCAREEAWGNYDKAQRRAIKWLRDRISQEALIALVRDPKTGDILKLDRDKWASMSDFEIEVTIVMGARQTVFFDRKNFDDVMRNIAPPDGDKAAPAPTASKARSELQELVIDFYNQLWPGGYKGPVKERDKAIMLEFEKQKREPPDPRTIRRALKPD